MCPILLVRRLAVILLAAATTSVAAQASAAPHVNLATSFDFERPFGVLLGTTTCAELAARLRRSWERSSDGNSLLAVDYDHEWQGWVTAIDSCNKPDESLEKIEVAFAARASAGTQDGTRTLFDAFARRLSVQEGGWQVVYRNAGDLKAPRVVVRNPNVTVSVEFGGGHTRVNVRNHRFSEARQAAIQRAVVRPLGIAIGISTCHEAANELDSTPAMKREELRTTLLGQPMTLPLDTFVVAPGEPARFYPGATDIEASCDDLDEAVNTLYVGVRDGADNAAARDAYRVLLSKYKKVEGGPIPGRGAGYARFATAGVSIELKAWGGGQDFMLTYMVAQQFERLKKGRERRRGAL